MAAAGFCRCFKFRGSASGEPAFRDLIFSGAGGVDPDSDDDRLMRDGNDDFSLDQEERWSEAGLGLRCADCRELSYREPMELVHTFFRTLCIDATKAVPRFSDTAVMTMVSRSFAMACGAAATREGVMRSGSGVYFVAAIYQDIVHLLDLSWREPKDRSRPFLRLRSGRLLHMKFLLELTFSEAFEPAAHPTALSQWAVSLMAALEAGEATKIWSLLQQVDDPNRRLGLAGPRDSKESQMACVVLQLLGFEGLLLCSTAIHLELCKYSVETALRRMASSVVGLSSVVPPATGWLAGWQLLDVADRLFRWVESPAARQSCADLADRSDDVRMWAVECAAERTVWTVGDSHGSLVAVHAVQLLILWRDFLTQQGYESEDLSILQAIEDALTNSVRFCAAAVADVPGSEQQDLARRVTSVEAQAVMALLNDSRLAGAVKIAAQRPCLIHGRNVPWTDPACDLPALGPQPFDKHVVGAIAKARPETVCLPVSAPSPSPPEAEVRPTEPAASPAARPVKEDLVVEEVIAGGSPEPVVEHLPADGAAAAALLAALGMEPDGEVQHVASLGAEEKEQEKPEPEHLNRVVVSRSELLKAMGVEPG